MQLFSLDKQKQQRKSKGWWSKNIKKSRNELKKANQRFKRRQSIANLEINIENSQNKIPTINKRIKNKR